MNERRFLSSRIKRKALGQHFLKEGTFLTQLVERIRYEITQTPCDILLEIGPGKGALTEPLLRRSPPFASSFFLVEKDPELAAFWQGRLSKKEGLFQGDFLDFRPPASWAGKRIGVFSNLPYSSGTAILKALAIPPWVSQIAWMVLMFQAEVGQRLRAGPGETHRGSLSVWIQNRWEVTSCLRVPPSAFQPPPKVFSEVLCFRPRAQPLLSDFSWDDEALWNRLLAKAFSQKRKMLRSLFHTPLEQSCLKEAQVDPTLRAEALTEGDWKALWKAWKQLFSKNQSLPFVSK